MFGLLDWIKIGFGASVGALLFYHIGTAIGERVGREAEQAAARARAMHLIEERRQDDAEISLMDMAALCVELYGRWVPNENRCD